jgi:hypothetical protein
MLVKKASSNDARLLEAEIAAPAGGWRTDDDVTKRAGGKSMEAQEPRGTRRVRGYNWKGPRASLREQGRSPVMPQGRYSCVGMRPAASGTTASGTLEKRSYTPGQARNRSGRREGVPRSAAGENGRLEQLVGAAEI